jgi:hypothetical protein
MIGHSSPQERARQPLKQSKPIIGQERRLELETAGTGA